MTKKKKASIIVSSVLLLIASAMAAFYFTRPLVVVVTENMGKDWQKRLPLGARFSSERRIDVVTKDEWKGEGDFVLDLTLEGISGSDDIKRLEYSALSLFEPLIPMLGDSVPVYIYDEYSSDQLELLDLLAEVYPNLKTIGYDWELSESRWGIEKKKIGPEDVLIIPDLYPVLDFVKELGCVRLCIDYLDAASLETIEPEFVAGPDFDAIIAEGLK